MNKYLIVLSILLSLSIQKEFVWGVATASYQIEGAWNEDGKGRNIWDDFCLKPDTINNNDTGEVADDFYHKFDSDIELMASLGLKNYRMSLSWPRLLPNGTADQVNQLGVDFYNKVFDKLESKGIEPWVTLYHWDLPSVFQDMTNNSAWLNKDIVNQFANYADFCFQTFGHRVKYWITINEPTTYGWVGYGTGGHAPGRCSSYMSDTCESIGGGGDTPTEPYIVFYHTLLAHAKAVQVYRQKYQKEQQGQIGINIPGTYYEPYNTSVQNDIDAVETALLFNFAIFYDPVFFGDYPQQVKDLITDNRLPLFSKEESEMMKGSWDFIGLNHYSTNYAQYTGVVGKDYSSDSRVSAGSYNASGDIIGEMAESTWLFVYPQGLRKLLNWIANRYNNAPIYVFENGVSVPDESNLPLAEALNDTFRVNYYQGYISNMLAAKDEDGVNMVGYFAWSFMDNFEWADGYSVRFGMVYIDYNDQSRYVKQSAKWYSKFTQEYQAREQLFLVK